MIHVLLKKCELQLIICLNADVLNSFSVRPDIQMLYLTSLYTSNPGTALYRAV